MTEKSYLWDGTTVGDATLAPYLKDAFNTWLSAQFVNNDTSAPFVIPGYLDDLKTVVSSGSINTVAVYPGAAIVKNYIYINNSEKYFTVDSITDTTKSYRYDSIILQLNNNTVRLALVKGAESATYPPTPSIMTQTEDLWQVELHRILVDSTSYVLSQQYVYDQRYFIPTNLYRKDSTRNLVANSEFMAYFDSTFAGMAGQAGILGTGWWGSGTIGTTGYARTAVLSPQARGRSLHITNCEVDCGVFQFLFLHKDLTLSVEGLVQPQNANSPVLVALIGRDVNAIEVERREILVPGIVTTTTRVRFTYTFTDPTIAEVLLSITNAGSAGAAFKIGQFLVCTGYFTGGLRPIHEVLTFKSLPDGSWNGDAKSTGTTTIDLVASFGGEIPLYTRAIILTLRCRDSASAGAANVGLYTRSILSAIVHGMCQIARVTNDKWRTAQCIVPVDDDLRLNGDITQQRFVLGVTATGAGTLDAYAEIVGIII